MIGVLYSWGLSLRRLAWMWARFGYDVSYVTCWRDIQRLGAEVCPQGPAPGTKVPVVYQDETYIKVRGRPWPVAAVRDPQGSLLRLQVIDKNGDWQAWLAPLAEGWGGGGGGGDHRLRKPLAHLALLRQQCMVYMLRTFHRAVRRMTRAMREQYAAQLQAMAQLLKTLPADEETQLRTWLEEAVAAGEPLTGPRGAGRRWVPHMWDHWPQMTMHPRRPRVPPTITRLEGRFGRVKPRMARLPQRGHALALQAAVWT